MRGYGKIILFGEHSVVYGYPALATSLDVGVLCKIEPHNKYQLNVPCLSLVMNDNDSEHVLGKVFNKILSYFPQKKQACRIDLFPEIPLGAGLGSSAATSVSIIRGLLKHHNLVWDNNQVNDVAFAAETIFHGTPSGIDNTIATFGGMCYLRNAQEFPAPRQSIGEIPLKKLTISQLPVLSKPLQLMIVNTKRERRTKDLVDKVREFRNKNQVECDKTMQKMGSFAAIALDAFEREDFSTIGHLFDENQCCLQKIGVSCSEIDFVCDEARRHGALGAKLTGAGGGGCVIVLVEKQQPQLQEILEQRGFEVFYALCGKDCTRGK
ncbi:mevalonate kinase [Candidatus Uabimicrobium amorphum]|uniref:mevalonate kinase n=1 Tax=Uabimicrobium amorphum TaxID=2596890 RepID=A0A5S9F3Z2_UABAM|nr:mevalonate kinase [Candidatus Uabimicrobium amorphum]BBM84039.1 mevalonate kinase [Candidatus Uabimicrobium amorphum]